MIGRAAAGLLVRFPVQGMNGIAGEKGGEKRHAADLPNCGALFRGALGFCRMGVLGLGVLHQSGAWAWFLSALAGSCYGGSRLPGLSMCSDERERFAGSNLLRR